MNILMAISRETGWSWSCARLQPSFVRNYNAELERQKSPIKTMWPDENAPAYYIQWENAAFHGEYAGERTWPDGRRETVTWEQLELDEKEGEAAVERMRHNEAIQERCKRVVNRPSPVEIGAELKAITSAEHTTALNLTLTLKNTTDVALKIPNPFLHDIERGFVDVQLMVRREGRRGTYHVKLPQAVRDREPLELLLRPGATVSRAINILGAELWRDREYSEAGFLGNEVEMLQEAGAYEGEVWFYYKLPAGEEHGGVFDIPAFDIK